MGDLISLSERRADQSRASLSEVAFFFGIECPRSYLAAERVERALGAAMWVPVITRGLRPLGAEDAAADEAASHACFARAEREAQSLGLPLVAPAAPAADPRAVARAACYAAELGAARRFAIAAARLVFCGGWSVDDPRLIPEAAGVAGVAPRAAVAASKDARYDERLIATSERVRARSGAFAPAVRIGEHWFSGPEAVRAAATYRAQRAALAADYS